MKFSEIFFLDSKKRVFLKITINHQQFHVTSHFFTCFQRYGQPPSNRHGIPPNIIIGNEGMMFCNKRKPIPGLGIFFFAGRKEKLDKVK